MSLVRKLQNMWEGTEFVAKEAMILALNGIIDRAPEDKVLLGLDLL